MADLRCGAQGKHVEVGVLRIGSLFSGIGGLELGLERASLGHTTWQVEQSEFCRSVLARHWPSAERHSDVRKVGAHNLDPVDIICGGFPCQDVSSAGKGEGLAGSRSGLWFEFARIVCELRPEWVVVENVASGAKRWVDQVCSELEQLGYEVLPVPLSAEDVGAPHKRARVFIIAHAVGQPLRVESRRGSGPHRESAPQPRFAGEARGVAHAHRQSESVVTEHEQASWLCAPTEDGRWEWRPPVSPVCGVDDGVPDRVDRLRALGNAVVPQCAEVIGWMIKEMMNDR